MTSQRLLSLLPYPVGRISPRPWFTVLLLVAIGWLAGCASHGLQPGEGYAAVPGGRVWYRIVGSGVKTPLLLLHGGPGVPSNYLNPLAALADERPVIFFDQLGTGRSEHPEDQSLWTIERYVKEVAAVREALGLKEVVLYGHSWGTILAAEYMYTRPLGVRGLVLASPALSIPRWSQDAADLLRTLPAKTQEIIARNERAKTYDAPEYHDATMEYYKRYLARRQPWSADIEQTFAQLNPAIYVYMNGPSEFSLTGTLKGYDSTRRLKELTVPTLFIAGRYDEAPPATTQHYQSMLPGAELAIIENAGHLTMQDEPERNIQILRDFLDRLDAR